MKGRDGCRGERSRGDTSDQVHSGTLSFATSASCIDLRQYVVTPERRSIAADLQGESKQRQFRFDCDCSHSWKNSCQRAFSLFYYSKRIILVLVCDVQSILMLIRPTVNCKICFSSPPNLLSSVSFIISRRSYATKYVQGKRKGSIHR